MQAQAAWFYPNPLHGTAVYMPIKPDPPGTTTPNARFSVLSSAVPDPWPTSPGVARGRSTGSPGGGGLRPA